MPTPAGVPVISTSPGSRVMVRLMKLTSSATPNIIWPVSEDWRSSSLTRQRMPRACGSGTSSAVTRYGPRGRKVSIALPSSHWLERNWSEREDTSLAQV